MIRSAHRTKQAKIIATLGPVSSGVQKIIQLADAGAGVFRLNFSHGTYDEHAARIQAVRLAEEELGYPLGLFMDLQGPKFRLGAFQKGKAFLKIGQPFVFDLDANRPGDDERVCMPHPEILEAVRVGDRLLIDDGKMIMSVSEVTTEYMVAIAQVEGVISDRKGISLPDNEIKVSALTEKDKRDLVFGLERGIASVALSFVQRPEDIQELRHLAGRRIQLISKIEKPTALNYLDEIIAQSDAVMVARGDLGVEMPPEKVPAIQKKIVAAARNQGCPVIVATQMLESMINTPTATRAEASDVATAIYDGVDAVMLSAETAAGDYPVETVSFMARVISEVENDALYRSLMDASRNGATNTATDAISAAARQVASTIEAKVIICYSTSGKTALRAARERPEAPIIVLTADTDVARALSLVWSAYAIVCPDAADMKAMVQSALEVVQEKQVVEDGDSVVITAGVPFGNAGTTNVLRIAKVGVDA
ncbi:MAG: pyruvate kinase [Sneathiella sp.]